MVAPSPRRARRLRKYAATLKTNLDLRAVKSWSRQILQGLDYLHSQSPPIVHRDLKCDNIFVNQNQGEVKIGDRSGCHAGQQQDQIGDRHPGVLAPELYDEDYDERVDITRSEYCIIELVTRRCPQGVRTRQIFGVTEGVKPEALDEIIDADLRSFVLVHRSHQQEADGEGADGRSFWTRRSAQASPSQPSRRSEAPSPAARISSPCRTPRFTRRRERKLGGSWRRGFRRERTRSRL